MKSRICMLFLLLSTLGYASQDSAKESDLYYSIGNVVITEVTSESDQIAADEFFNQKDSYVLRSIRPDGAAKKGGGAISVINNFLVLGQKLWKIVEGGTPVANVSNLKTLDVLPSSGGKSLKAFDLSGWSLPRARAYKVEIENGLGMKVVTFHYRLFYSFGGSFDGSGAYLTGVTVEPRTVSPAWGFKFDAESKLISVTDIGNKSTGQNAALTLQLTYRVRSVVSDVTRTETYTITGDGKVYEY